MTMRQTLAITDSARIIAKVTGQINGVSVNWILYPPADSMVFGSGMIDLTASNCPQPQGASLGFLRGAPSWLIRPGALYWSTSPQALILHRHACRMRAGHCSGWKPNSIPLSTTISPPPF